MTRSISSTVAAKRLGVHRETVVSMIKAERLRGAFIGGRWLIEVDNDNHMLDGAGHMLVESDWNFEARLQGVSNRVEALEQNLASLTGMHSDRERFRDAAILLAATSEHQKKASDLQHQAISELNEVVAEQGRIIATLLVPEPDEILEQSGER